ncbi:MAG TPA: hypothetical protein PLB05_09050, partial [Candidatus Omnitrophota bacterium]|nr:hypothetical protein [Candidatus Omnitrophota bacterium]
LRIHFELFPRPRRIRFGKFPGHEVLDNFTNHSGHYQINNDPVRQYPKSIRPYVAGHNGFNSFSNHNLRGLNPCPAGKLGLGTSGYVNVPGLRIL